MTHRALGVLLLLGVLAVLLGAPTGVAMAAPGNAPSPPDTIVDVVTPITDNDFIPDRDLDDCVSALPQPGCGSEARSGGRQWAIFGLLVGALAFMGWRIARSVRRAEPTADRRSDDT